MPTVQSMPHLRLGEEVVVRMTLPADGEILVTRYRGHLRVYMRKLGIGHKWAEYYHEDYV